MEFHHYHHLPCPMAFVGHVLNMTCVHVHVHMTWDGGTGESMMKPPTSGTCVRDLILYYKATATQSTVAQKWMECTHVLGHIQYTIHNTCIVHVHAHTASINLSHNCTTCTSGQKMAVAYILYGYRSLLKWARQQKWCSIYILYMYCNGKLKNDCRKNNYLNVTIIGGYLI